MSKKKPGRNSRRNYKRRRRAAQREALLRSQQSNVIVTVPTPAVSNNEIVDYYPSLIDPTRATEKSEYEKPPAIIPTPAANPPIDTLSPCDKRLIEILADPAKFAEFQSKVKSTTANQLIIVS